MTQDMNCKIMTWKKKNLTRGLSLCDVTTIRNSRYLRTLLLLLMVLGGANEVWAQYFG